MSESIKAMALDVRAVALCGWAPATASSVAIDKTLQSMLWKLCCRLLVFVFVFFLVVAQKIQSVWSNAEVDCRSVCKQRW